MKNILVYGDSMSWGLVPGTRKRLSFDERWPGILENICNQKSVTIRVLENCLNGRRTAWEDPFKPGRNGMQGIQQVVEMNSPLDLIILMLGTNDFQAVHTNTAIQAACGVAALIQAMGMAPIEPGMPVPPVLLVVPPQISQPKGLMADNFGDVQQKCLGLAEKYMDVSRELKTYFYDASQVVCTSEIDGVHLDKTQHRLLGEALAVETTKILGALTSQQPMKTP